MAAVSAKSSPDTSRFRIGSLTKANQVSGPLLAGMLLFPTLGLPRPTWIPGQLCPADEVC